MTRLLCVLAAVAAIGIALFSSGSLARQEETRESAGNLHGPAAQEVEPSLAPVELAVATNDASAAAAGATREPVLGEREELRDASVLEVIVLARETLEPVAGALVTVTAMRGMGRVDPTWAGLELSTGADGTAFGEVPAGKRLVVHTRLGGAQRFYESVEDFAPGERRRVELEVRTGEDLRVSVRVLDAEDDAPIAGARLALARTYGDESLGAFTTGPDGRVELDLRAEIECGALVEAEGYGARSVSITDGNVSGAAKLSLRLQRSAALVARVHDEHGVGLAGCEVVLEASADRIADREGLIRSNYSNLEFQASTAADGTCSFESLPPEVPFTLYVTLDGEFVGCEAQPVTLAPGESRELELCIGCGITITGRVLDPDGNPVFQHQVRLLVAREGRPRAFWEYLHDEAASEAETDEHGRFAFDEVGPGRWWLGAGERNEYIYTCSIFVPEPDPLAGELEVIEDASGDSDRDGILWDARGLPAEGFAHDEPALFVPGLPEVIEVAPGDPDREVILRVTRGFVIQGRVLDPQGEPVEGVIVATGSIWHQTEADGRFRLSPLPEGEREVEATAFARWASPQPKKVRAGARDVVIQMLEGGKLVAQVRDPSGLHVNSRIRVSCGAESVRGRPTTAGSAQFTGLAPGTYAVVASSSDGCAVVRNVAIDAGRTTEVSLLLAPPARLTVRYAGKYPKARLEVWSDDALVAEERFEAGTSHACSVPPGPLRVAMEIDGVTEERSIEARVGEHAVVAFE